MATDTSAAVTQELQRRPPRFQAPLKQQPVDSIRTAAFCFQGRNDLLKAGPLGLDQRLDVGARPVQEG